MKLTNKAKIQLEERKERSALQAVLDLSFEELGHAADVLRQVGRIGV